jgi:hypothetical protein
MVFQNCEQEAFEFSAMDWNGTVELAVLVANLTAASTHSHIV